MAGYQVAFTPAAERQLARLPRRSREMVAAAIVTLATNPRPSGGAKLAGADDLWRIRARQYRVIYQVRDAELIVIIVNIGDRKEVYR